VPLFLLLLALADLPAGQLVESVKCADDPTQSYALYQPARISPDRVWPVIFAFDPGGRGRIPVERYQAAAEKYGYIVAGSNNSRNGSWAVSMSSAQAMMTDVARRFSLDPQRIYTAGMSGGSRVALGVALGVPNIAGVIASSAGFPDSKPRKSVPFPIFGTAGTEDFNYLEMRRLDRELTTPHHLAVFDGGHLWLSSDLAVEAVEWMELQAMKSARKPRDEVEIQQIYSKRASAAGGENLAALQSLVADFTGLKDVSAQSAQAAALARDKRARNAAKKERAEEAREELELQEILGLESQLAVAEQRASALAQLRSRWKHLAAESAAPEDTPERRIARRVSRGLSMSARDRIQDPDYQKILAEYRPQSVR
jgi:poly(3-hydroxybutyrate) depolymerase